MFSISGRDSALLQDIMSMIAAVIREVEAVPPRS
jgi:hypothetical protein